MKPKNSSQLKALARGRLLGNYRTFIYAFILSSGSILVLSMLLTSFLEYSTLYEIILNELILYLLDIFAGLFTMGLVMISLKILSSQPAGIQDLFYGFRQNTNKILFVSFVLVSLERIGTLPFTITTYFVEDPISYTSISLLMIFAIPAILVTMYVELNYMILYYLIADFPDYSVKKLFHLSKKLMRGNRLRLLYLLLSFIPLLLLCVLTMGLAMFWIFPYISVTLAHFYIDLIQNSNSASFSQE